MRFPVPVLEAFSLALLAAHGLCPLQAAGVTRHALWCETAGRPNFGLQRYPVYLKRVAAGVLNPAPSFVWDIPSDAICKLDADNGFGLYAAEEGMARAIELARSAGIGITLVRNSNFFGAGAFYVQQAAAAGMIGLAMSNSFPKVVAHGGLKPVFGTNPFAFGAPRASGESILFDMATSALAGSTVREHLDKGLPLPAGLAIDAAGAAITDPARVNGGALLPFGGAKGSGLALLVELLAGVLSGAGVAHGVGSMYADFSRGGDNGHFLMAIDIARLMPLAAYHARLETLVQQLAQSAGLTPVRLPGAARWRAQERAAAEGVELDPSVLAALAQLARERGVRPLPLGGEDDLTPAGRNPPRSA